MNKGDKLQQATVGTASALAKEALGRGGERGSHGQVDSVLVEELTKEWPSVPRKAADMMIEQYGQPNEATQSRLIWFGNGPWLRTILYRDEIPHNFPKPHTDVLEQFVNYRVPPEKFDELAAFDGSIVIERTKGEASARCDMEAMNILALNLMHDIVTGQRTVEEARSFYADAARDFMMNRPVPYTERLNFDPRASGTADADRTAFREMMT